MIQRSFNRYLQYSEKTSTQTLQEALEEYYKANPNATNPNQMRSDFAKLLIAHDVSHVVFGYDTDMCDEWRLFFFTFFVSNYKFKDYVHDYRKWLRDRDDPSVSVTFDDVLKERSAISWYAWVVITVLRLIPEIVVMRFQTLRHQKYWLYYEHESMLDCSLLDIRKQFNLLRFMPSKNKPRQCD